MAMNILSLGMENACIVSKYMAFSTSVETVRKRMTMYPPTIVFLTASCAKFSWISLDFMLLVGSARLDESMYIY